MIRFVEVARFDDLGGAVLVCAAGFEERAVAFARRAASGGVRFGRFVVIEYLPHHVKNRLEELLELGSLLAPGSVERVVFDRRFPGECEDLTQEALAKLSGGGRVVLDLSGMSRFLICLLVARLIRANVPLGLVYTEPDDYRPTKDEADSAFATIADSSDMMFLTTGLYGFAAVDDLTTATMQGYPELLVASPTFEPRLMRALLNEMSPAKVVLMEGIPAERYKWRRDSVRRLNVAWFETAIVVSVPTDGIEEATKAMWAIFRKYKYEFRIIVAPAASKLVAVGLAAAIAQGVEVEVVYPTPSSFSDPYSDGARESRFWMSESVEDTGVAGT